MGNVVKTTTTKKEKHQNHNNVQDVIVPLHFYLTNY